jgi:hypothetical protein
MRQQRLCSSSLHRTGKARGPRRDTNLNVTILGDQQRYRVLAGQIERWLWPNHAAGTTVRRYEQYWTALIFIFAYTRIHI